MNYYIANKIVSSNIIVWYFYLFVKFWLPYTNELLAQCKFKFLFHNSFIIPDIYRVISSKLDIRCLKNYNYFWKYFIPFYNFLTYEMTSTFLFIFNLINRRKTFLENFRLDKNFKFMFTIIIIPFYVIYFHY